MAKINDNLFCVAGKNSFIFIVSVELVQVIQKINIADNDNSYMDKYVKFLLNCNNEFIFTSFDDKKIIQFKIIVDEEINFFELEKVDILEDENFL